MKKLLTALSAITLTATTTTAVVSCGPSSKMKTKKITQAGIKTEVEEFLSSQTFNSREQAIKALSDKQWKAEGINALQSSAMSDILPRSIYITPLLKPNYSWENEYDKSFSAMFQLDITQTVQNKYQELTSIKYLSIDDAKTKISQGLESLYGIKSVNFTWIDSTNMKFTVAFNYETNIIGPKSLSGTALQKVNLTNQITEVIESFEATKFDSEKQLQEALNKSLKEINGVSSVKLILDSTNSKTSSTTYKIEVTYKDGFGGLNYYKQSFLMKTDLTNQIKDLLDSFATTYFDTRLAAEAAIEQKLKTIGGISEVRISATPLENTTDIYNYTITPKYDSNDYTGAETYQNQFKVKTNITTLVNDKQQAFETQEFANYFDAESKAKELLESINGIFSVKVNEVNKEASTITLKLVCDDKFVVDATEVQWNFKVAFPKINKIENQQLSYRDQSITKTIAITGSKLDNKTLIATAAKPDLLAVKVENQNLTITALTNVSGAVTSQITLQVANAPETMISFNVTIQGQPEVEILTPSLPKLLKMRIGWEQEIDFKLNYFDPATDKIAAAPSDNDGQTAGEIVAKDASLNIYTLKIKALKGNNIANNGQQQMNILVNDAVAKSFGTQIYTLPILSSSISNSSQLAIKTYSTATMELKLELSDPNDKVSVRVSDNDGIVVPTLTKIDDANYKLDIYGAKSNSFFPIGGNQDVVISINGTDVWKINTRVR
ncbi:lipoprotein [Mesoplasma seiffertii]|uniref:lipoprotein n=1 Tax=Mesoplasma seiffertii TaxID=28224 RepID=UPI000478B7B5|nr:lipoprotein [Mesoplasma seiffertii]